MNSTRFINSQQVGGGMLPTSQSQDPSQDMLLYQQADFSQQNHLNQQQELPPPEQLSKYVDTLQH